jgi:hypothetical protein
MKTADFGFIHRMRTRIKTFKKDALKSRQVLLRVQTTKKTTRRSRMRILTQTTLSTTVESNFPARV